ncbi:MAG TPA: Mur ligase family protein [Candidatus Limnocylindrales bacterium]|nr:Mur ligase family protein [Candidatus Limnocylindrales bacterium]
MAELGIVLACLAAGALAALRWLRIVQRDQYYPAAVRFARRWWLGMPVNLVLLGVAVVGALLAPVTPWAALLTAAAAAVGPLGLSVRGRTAPLAWSRRLVRLAIVLLLVNTVLLAVVTLVAVVLELAPLHALVVGGAQLALLQPVIVDLAGAISRPIEARLMRVFVGRATRRLRQVGPTVVAITGSYGKTTTKGYVRQLVAPVRTVVASPASYNNTGGLARAINEQLLPGTDVFVAEMGTYGAGEIAQLCRWIPPDVAVITAIGPVHLERMGSLDAIVRAKSEILERARVCVLNVDGHGLAAVADALGPEKVVWRCSERDPTADVHASLDEGGTLHLSVRGRELAALPGATAQPINVACAVAVAIALDVPEATIADALPGLTSAEHRLQVASAANGATVIDDTYNSNPAGSRAALAALQRVDARRRAVVTPGMIELGSVQATENEAFARAAAEVADDLLLVNRTNRPALLRGARGGRAQVHVFDRREQAVAWVRANLGPADAVLYENDLPDTYP